MCQIFKVGIKRALNTSVPSTNSRPKNYKKPIHLGYVPLCDSAPVVIAKELGIFDSHGIRVKLVREPGWATVRDKLAFGELDAAESIVGLVFALQLGLGCLAREVITPLILSANGNAITLGSHVPQDIFNQENGLKNYLLRDFKNERPFTLAAVHPFSCHNFLLHNWLRRQGVTPGEQVEIVFLPPSVLARNLEAGTIDGFCVGEPWNSKTILTKQGWCAVTSRDLDHGHPEKALLCSEEFSQNRTDEMLQLTSALYEACIYCSDSNNREELIRILSRSKYLDTKKDYIANSYSQTFETGHQPLHGEDMILYHGADLNTPSSAKANWVLSNMRQTRLIPNSMSVKNINSIFRADIFEEAIKTSSAIAS